MATAVRPCIYLIRQSRPLQFHTFRNQLPSQARRFRLSAHALAASDSSTGAGKETPTTGAKNNSSRSGRSAVQSGVISNELEEEDEDDDEGFDPITMAEQLSEVDDISDLLPREFEEETPEPERADGYFAEDEDDPADAGEDYEFEPDDITSTAHAELEQVRELRELERAIAWDMPLLYQYRKKAPMPSTHRPLRWKYNSFLGDTHAASSKVVLSFRPDWLVELSEPQKMKLKKLLGARYNPEKGRATMSCDSYPTVAQNKRFLGELLEKLRNEAKDSTDMLADIPLDTRHVRAKKNADTARFPASWRMQPDRAQYLESWRLEQAESEAQRIEAGDEVEGRRLLGGMGIEEEFVAVRRRRVRT